MAVFSPVLGLGFVWDDFGLYLDVPALRDTSTFWAGTLGTVHPDLHYFRPVALLTYKWQLLLLGNSTVGAHAISLALHGLNTFLVGALASRLAGGPGAGWRGMLAGLFYGLHPALIEPVSWMSCRFDLLITLWLLLALHADLGVRHAAIRAVTVAALYFVALNSKEMAAPFPAVLALVQLATRYRDAAWRDVPRRMARQDGLTHALLVAALAGYAALRAAFVGGTLDVDADIAAELDGAGARIAFVAATLLFHVGMVFAPFASLSPLHPVDLEALAFTARDLTALAPAAALVLALAAGVARRQRSLVLLMAAVVALVPVLNLVPASIARNIGHERYLTFPLTLVALALAALPLPRPGTRHFRALAAASMVAATGWLLLCIANIRVTVPLWRSDVTLWTWAHAKNPGSDYAHYSLVTSLLRAGRPDLAVSYLTDDVPRTPYRALTHFEYAKFLINGGQVDDGGRHLRRALRGFPPWHVQAPADARSARAFETHRGNIGIAYTYLAQLELIDGRFEAARFAAAVAQFYYPRYRRALLADALALYGMDAPEEGRTIAAAALTGAAEEERRLLERWQTQFLGRLCAGQSPPRRSCAGRT